MLLMHEIMNFPSIFICTLFTNVWDMASLVFGIYGYYAIFVVARDDAVHSFALVPNTWSLEKILESLICLSVMNTGSLQ